MKKKRLALIVALVVSLVAGVVSLAACGGGDNGENGDKAFSAPKNAKITGTLFTWDPVENDDNGYTVKINSGEVTVEVAQLDLTSAKAFAYIKEGDNQLSVKVNETDTLKASAYTSAKTYTYTIPEGELSEAASAFKTAVNAIATLDASSDKEAIDGASTAITTALADYENLSEDDQAAVRSVKNSLDAKKEALDVAINAQISAYYAAIKVAEKAVTDNAPVADLEAAITAANAKKAALAEATKAAKADEYAAYNARLETVKEALDALQGSGADIKELKDAVDALKSTTPVSEEYYEELTALMERIEALDDAAAALWNEADTAKVEAEITRVETTVVKTNKVDDAYGFGDGGRYVILREYKNVLGAKIDPKTVPTLTYQVNDGTAAEVSLEKVKDGVYRYTINYDMNKEDGNKFVYTVSGEKEQEYTISAAGLNNVYLNFGANLPGERASMFTVDEGVNKLDINATIADGTLYMDMYYATDIDMGNTKVDSHVLLLGAPLITRIEGAYKGMTEESFKALLARKYSSLWDREDLNVRFVFYSEKEEDGVIHRTKISNVSISESYPLEISAEDTKEKLYIGNGGYQYRHDLKDGIELGAAFAKANLVAQFDDNIAEGDVYKLLDFVIDVTKEGASENLSFRTPVPWDAFISGSILKTKIFEFYHDLESSDYTVSFRLSLNEEAAKKYGDRLKDSVAKEVAWPVQISLPGNEDQVRFNGKEEDGQRIGGDAFEFLRTANGNGSVFDFGVSHIELTFAKGDKSYTAYMFNVDGALKIYAKADKSGDVLSCDVITNGWTSITSFNDWVKKDSTYALAGFDAKDGWSFTTKVIYDGKYNGKTDGGESNTVVYIPATPAVTE